MDGAELWIMRYYKNMKSLEDVES